MYIKTVLCLLIICCSNKKDNLSEPIKRIGQKGDQTLQTKVIRNDLDKGFLVLKKTYTPKKPIVVYNIDESIWKTIKFDDNYNDELINPTAIKSENILLVFKCLGREKGFYKVVVNDDNNILKFIKESDPNFEFQTIQDHILTVFSVEFDEKNNPLRLKANEDSKKEQINNNSFYYPVEIQKNWLKVEDDNKQQFWIKWSDDQGNLILKLYYDA